MAISAADLNALYETYLGRPADTAGIQGYQSSGKSLDEIAADLAWVAASNPETGLTANAQYYEAPSASQLQYIQGLGGGTPTYQIEDTFQAPADSPGMMLQQQQQQAQTGGTSTGPVDAINNTTVNKLADQLKAQYDALNQNAGYTYGGKQSDLDKMFRAQAAKLAVNGINDLADVGEADGMLVNKVTGDVIKKVNLQGEDWQNDGSTSFKFAEDIALEDRGSFQRWGKDTSVDGQADYGINFVDGQAVMVPIWKDTKTDTGPLAAIAAVGLTLAFPQLAGQVGSFLASGASPAVQAAVGSAALAGVSTGVITGDMDKALIAAATAGGAQYLNASGALGELFDTVGLTDYKDAFGVTGGTQTLRQAATEDALQLATTGSSAGDISRILQQDYGLDQTLATNIGKNAFDVAFAATDAQNLFDLTGNAAAVKQNLIASGIDTNLAENLAMSASMGGAGGNVSSLITEAITADPNLISKVSTNTGGMFTGTSSDLTNAGITTGGQGINLSQDQLANIISGNVSGATFAEQVVNAGGTIGADAAATGMLDGVTDKIKDVAGNVLGDNASGLFNNLIGAGIDYATADKIAKEASSLGRSAEATAIAAGKAANVPFTPYTISSGAGRTDFGVDPVTGRPTATVTAAQPYADLRTQALGAAGSTLGAIDPAAAAESLFQRSEALAGPARQRETEALLSSLSARGLLGVSRNLPTVGGITGVTPGTEGVTGLTPGAGGVTGVNPYLESLLSAQRTAQARTALEATQFGTQEAQRQAALANALIGTGQGIDTAALGTLTTGANLGSLATAADQTSAGRLLEATLAGQRLRLPYENIGLMTRGGALTGAADVGKSITEAAISELFK